MRQWILREIIIRATWDDEKDYILKIYISLLIYIYLLSSSQSLFPLHFLIPPSLCASVFVSLLRPPYSTLRLNALCSV